MVTAKIDRGLCMTCNNASSCFYLQSRGPALFCELFDDYVRPELRTVHEKGLALRGLRLICPMPRTRCDAMSMRPTCAEVENEDRNPGHPR